jgi:heme-degrading monooxygenase HmoA
MIATTPAPPYYAVIFTSIRTNNEHDYKKMDARMEELAKNQEGYLGIESARNDVGITISYWKDLESIKKWKEQSEHAIAQDMGKNYFYTTYKVRISLVQKDYIFEKNK